MTKPSHFQSEFDKVFSGFIKEAGGPPPLPDDVYEQNPWADVEGEEKPIAQMNKEELAGFIRGLDDQTFNELKVVLDKVEMPDDEGVITSAPNLAQDMDDEGVRVTDTARATELISELAEDFVNHQHDAGFGSGEGRIFPEETLKKLDTLRDELRNLAPTADPKFTPLFDLADRFIDKFEFDVSNHRDGDYLHVDVLIRGMHKLLGIVEAFDSLSSSMVSMAMEGSSSKETLEDALHQMELGEDVNLFPKDKSEQDQEDEEEIRHMHQAKGKEDAEKLEEWMAQVESPVLWHDGNRPGTIHLSSGLKDKEDREENGGAPHELTLNQALHLLRDQPYAGKEDGELYFDVENLANPDSDADDRHTRPTVEMPVDADPKRHTRPTIQSLPVEKQEFLSSPQFDAAFVEWKASRDDELKSSPTFEEAYSEYEKVAKVRLSKRI